MLKPSFFHLLLFCLSVASLSGQARWYDAARKEKQDREIREIASKLAVGRDGKRVKNIKLTPDPKVPSEEKKENEEAKKLPKGERDKLMVEQFFAIYKEALKESRSVGKMQPMLPYLEEESQNCVLYGGRHRKEISPLDIGDREGSPLVPIEANVLELGPSGRQATDREPFEDGTQADGKSRSERDNSASERAVPSRRSPRPIERLFLP